jgi:putative serine protease PepD
MVIVAGCLIGPVLLAAIAFSALGGRPTDISAAKNLQRGRVVKLAAPRSGFEFSSIAELIEAVEPSVVQIKTYAGLGSGFVLDRSGLIVTCNHCIENALVAEVVFSNGRRTAVRGLVKAARDRDLAVIAIEPSELLQPLALAERPPKKGDPIVAFGSPVGLSFSTSEGSVSGLRTGQELMDLGGVYRGTFDLRPSVSLVQITASTMPGNSGGPVVDFSGNVIGISSFVVNWHGQVYEFCISAAEIQSLTEDLGDTITPLWDFKIDDH